MEDEGVHVWKKTVGKAVTNLSGPKRSGRRKKVLANEILPEFQHLEAGDVIPIGGSGPDWPVKSIEPPETLIVLGEPSRMGPAKV